MLQSALKSVDRQAPYLTYLGLGCWMAWNAIAFSGAFWLHDTESSIRSENLISVHLIACTATLLVVGMLQKHTAKLVAKNWFSFAGALVATLGTVLIVITRESILPVERVFQLGCVLSGVGTTLLFFRAAALFGALPPHRALYMLVGCELFSTAVFFALNSSSNEVANALFILLPLLSAALFSLRSHSACGERPVLYTWAPLSRKFIAFLLSIALCSGVLELMRGYILVSLPPSYSVDCAITSNLLSIPVMIAVALMVLLAKRWRDSFAKIYSVAVGALVITLMVVSIFSANSPIVASIASLICIVFNMIVWAMLLYLVYQTKANAVKILGLGNAALSLGTCAASLVTSSYFELGIDDGTMTLALALLGFIVLFDALFVFSDRQIENMLLPIDEKEDGEQAGRVEVGRPQKWVETCRQVAQAHHLSERETEILIPLARGRTAQEIADREVLSIYTVRAHTRSIYAKLGVHSKKELTAFIEKWQ